MSSPSSLERELAGLHDRITEVEVRLRRVELRDLPAPAAPSAAPAPRTIPTSAPVASPPPVAPPSGWPSTWAPSASATPSQPSQSPVMPTQNAPTQTASPPTQSVQVTVPKQEAQTVGANDFGAGVHAQPASPGASPSPFRSVGDWEQLVGGRLSLWIGAFCLFLALASLLVYVGQTLPPPTPAMRVASGFAASIGLFIGAAFSARRRANNWFPDGLCGAGLAVGFLSVWGGGLHFGLWSLGISLAGFVVFTALGVGLAARRDSKALLVMSATGGFLTPILVRQSDPAFGAWPFLTYLLILNIGLVAVSVHKEWRGIVYGVLGATVVEWCGWALDVDIEAFRLLAWAFTFLQFLLFGGAACWNGWVRRRLTTAEDSLLLFGASGFFSAGSLWLLAPALARFPGAFALGMTLFFAALWVGTRRFRAADVALQSDFLALACVAGAMFVPLHFGQKGLVWGWMAQSVALSLIGRKSGERRLQSAGRWLWALAVVALWIGASWSGGFGDGFSLRLAFCLIGTGMLAPRAQTGEPLAPLWSGFLSWGGALWLGRAVWNTVEGAKWVAPSQHAEVALLLGSSVLALWALSVWRGGTSSRLALPDLRAHGAVIGLLSLGTLIYTATFGGPSPLWARLLAYGAGLSVLLVAGRWRERAQSSDATQSFSLAAAGWILWASSLEVAAHFQGGRPDFPTTGSNGWFALGALWFLFAGVAGAVSLRRAEPKLWALAEAVFAVALSVLVMQSLLVTRSLEPLWNARLGAFALAWLVALGAFRVEKGNAKRRQLWMGALLLLPLWSSTQELWNGAAVYHALLGHEWQRFASLGVSLWWSFFAALCLVGGVWKRAQNVRLGALALGALTMCKVFLLDLSFLDGGLRVLSLGGLGACLMFVSWLYSRFGRRESEAGA